MNRSVGPVRVLLLCAWLLVCSLAGCATTLVYNHADWLLKRQLDAYFDLSHSQKAFVSARLHAIHDRHRREALPRYEQVLWDVRSRIQRGLSSDDLNWAMAQYDQLRADLFARFVQDGAEFVRSVEDRQLPRVKRALDKRLANQKRSAEETAEARLAEQTKRMTALAREWLGSLNSEQERQVEQLVMAFPDTLPITYAHQLRKNDQFMTMLESRSTSDVQAKLRQWMVHSEQDADPAFREATRQLRAHITQLVLALDRMATPVQRQHVIAKLDDLAHTVQDLQ